MDQAWPEVFDTARYLYEHPETGLHEYNAKTRLSSLLRAHGFSLQEVRGLPTAFIASSGTGRPHVALLAEYDALEGLGHACGHHLIAGTSILAGIGIASILGRFKGRISVVGCPAEETVGTKAVLVRRGVFRDTDAAMMIHPADKTEIVKLSLSLSRLAVSFTGVSSHASATPWNGKSALAGMLSLFHAIDANRITMSGKNRLNGIIRHGGTAANILPGRAEAEFFIRAPDLQSHNILMKRFSAMVRGAADAFGLGHAIRHRGNVYYPLRPNFALARVFADQAKKMHIPVDTFFTDREPGSSDIGNVSYAVPTIHPTLAISAAPCPAHSEAFRKQAGTPGAYRAIRTGAALLALTALDLYRSRALLSELKKDHYIEYS